MRYLPAALLLVAASAQADTYYTDGSIICDRYTARCTYQSTTHNATVITAQPVQPINYYVKPVQRKNTYLQNYKQNNEARQVNINVHYWNQ